MPLFNLAADTETKKRAKKARKQLNKIKTYKSDKKSFEGSLGVGISSIRKRKKRMEEIEAELGY
jgi:hypothetical protein